MDDMRILAVIGLMIIVLVLATAVKAFGISWWFFWAPIVPLAVVVALVIAILSSKQNPFL